MKPHRLHLLTPLWVENRDNARRAWCARHRRAVPWLALLCLAAFARFVLLTWRAFVQ